MKRRILRCLALAIFASSMSGCSMAGRAVGAAIKLPGTVLQTAGRTLGSLAGGGGVQTIGG